MSLRWAVLPAAGVAAGLAAARLLADPPATAVTRVLALVCGVATLGLCAVGWLDTDSRARRRADRQHARWRWIAAAAAAWFCLALTHAAAAAAGLGSENAGGLRTYLTDVEAGRVALLTLAATGLLAIGAAAAYRSGSAAPQAVGTAFAVAAAALVAPPLAGHMAQNTTTALLVVVHTLAAALWCGLLAAIAATARSRGDWALLLPRFSALAPWLVGAVAASGTLSAALALGGMGPLVGTGYGRLVCAKAAILLGLVGMAWWWRRTWVPAARTHRTTADVSLRRAALEVAVMAAAFALAGSLATSP